MKSFALYYGSPMLMERDLKLDKFAPTTVSDTLSHVLGFFQMLLITGALQTMFYVSPSLMPPMAEGQLPPDSDWYSLDTLLYPQKWLVRNLLFALFFQVYIAAFGEGLVVAQSLVTGYKTHNLMDNPCLTARSYSQFWGSKWNLVIHDVLKGGVYLPVRRNFPRYVAMLATFVASGVFHEVLLWVYTYPLDDKDGCFSDAKAAATKVDCYQPPHFATTLFFLWQAFLIAVEYSPLGQLSTWSKLPDTIATILVVITGGVFAHYFVEPYWNSLFFENATVLLFLVKPAAAMTS